MKISQTLGYMGLMPFIISLYLSINDTAWQLDAKQVFIAYSAIILSFVAGTLWQTSDETKHDRRKIVSNIFSLFAFLTFLVNQHLALAILAANYILLFLYESKLVTLNQENDRNPAYLTMRFRLTCIVVLLHGSAYYLW
ncbi:MAG: chromate transport protein ChrA [Moritella dasanensis]|jgi:chromate transport protein ChrA